MASSILNSDDGVISGTAGLKSVGGDDGNLVFQSKGTETARITTSGTLQLTDDLTFTGTGNRITGDMSNATVANRVAFQTSTANGLTTISVIPNGTSQTSNFQCIGGSDIANAAFGNFATDGSTLVLQSNIRGTGTYMPMAFSTGGSERMRIDTSGNVGIGTTSPSTYGKFAVSGLAFGSSYYVTSSSGGAAGGARFGAYFGSVNVGYVDHAVTDGTGGAESADIRFGTISSGTLAERMRITSAGDVGIGTSLPGAPLDVQGNSGAIGVQLRGRPSDDISVLRFRNNAANTTYGQFDVRPGVFIINAIANIPIDFYTNNTQRATLTAAGEFICGGATDQGAFNLQCNGTGVWGAGAYVNGSDERIKDDIEPIASGLDVVEKLNPVTYRYKESWTKDQSVQTGFIAQELLTALDGQVYVDGVVQQGGAEGYYSVAYQNIIPILTKAIQELKAELDTVKAELATLKGN